LRSNERKNFLQVCHIVLAVCILKQLRLRRDADCILNHLCAAGMSKRKQLGRGDDGGRYRPMQRTDRGAQSLRSYAGPKRYRYSRFYQGRGVRSGSYMLRRFRGLRGYPASGIETKYFDTAVTATALVAPPATAAWSGLDTMNPTTILALNVPQQGTGNTNREGRYITMESLQVNGIIAMAAQGDQTAADVAPTIKIWIVLDKQTNGGDAGTGIISENVFTNPGATAISGTAPLRNMLYSKRYKVLKEICIDAPQLNMVFDGTNVEQSGTQIPFSAFIPLKGRKTEFLGNAGTVADITTNGLFMVACTSSTQYAPQITYNARLRFRG